MSEFFKLKPYMSQYLASSLPCGDGSSCAVLCVSWQIAHLPERRPWTGTRSRPACLQAQSESLEWHPWTNWSCLDRDKPSRSKLSWCASPSNAESASAYEAFSTCISSFWITHIIPVKMNPADHDKSNRKIQPWCLSPCHANLHLCKISIRMFSSPFRVSEWCRLLTGGVFSGGQKISMGARPESKVCVRFLQNRDFTDKKHPAMFVPTISLAFIADSLWYIQSTIMYTQSTIQCTQSATQKCRMRRAVGYHRCRFCTQHTYYQHGCKAQHTNGVERDKPENKQLFVRLSSNFCLSHYLHHRNRKVRWEDKQFWTKQSNNMPQD